MDESKVSKEVKGAILKQELQAVYNTLYQLTIKARVAKDVGDDKIVENCTSLSRTNDPRSTTS